MFFLNLVSLPFPFHLLLHYKGGMKRLRRFDSDSDDDDADGYVEEPLLRYTRDDKDEMLWAMGLRTEEPDVESNGAGSSSGCGEIVEGFVTDVCDGQMRESYQSASNVRPPAVAARRRHAALREDRDVPDHWKGLMSEELLQVYFTTLSYAESGHSLDDKLLAQYLPYSEERFRPVVRADERIWENSYCIKPGWRWDGVVRGVSTTN
ncbi:Pre-mRNA-splicing factor of RES complex [Trypanosoma brucei equiperdum]|uniref:Pre-mRNA-splicing factor of RES complex n=1 Tax=Trypanosoma brucei equiperdum TaxID=630700 RepID=A0A3L6KTH7_9TRYP|nr:Pre-mRNA-splicing factor of RES complex [Trypanosoma brucei equiperdum]